MHCYVSFHLNSAEKAQRASYVPMPMLLRFALYASVAEPEPVELKFFEIWSRSQN